MKLQRQLASAALVLLVATACHSNHKVRPLVDPELARLSKEQVFDSGEQQFAKRHYPRARTFYAHVYENYPNDPLGRRALLRVADTYYAQGDAVNLVEAQYKYRDFINRYPGSDRADYALLQIGMVSYKQMEKPDRDQQKTHEAVDKLSDMIKTYPRSPLREEADKRLADAMNRLGAHEHIIAKFYMKRHSLDSAVLRLNTLIDKFPSYSARDEAFYDLAFSLDQLGRKGEARLYYERVTTEFPGSQWAAKAKHRLSTMSTI